MTFIDVLLLLVGAYYVIDGVAGFAQTRSWPFLSELFGAWLMASIPIVSTQPILWDALVAVGAIGVISIGATVWQLFRGDASRQEFRTFIAVKRQPRTTLERYTFRYKPYAQLPPVAPPRKVPARRARTR